VLCSSSDPPAVRLEYKGVQAGLDAGHRVTTMCRVLGVSPTARPAPDLVDRPFTAAGAR